MSFEDPITALTGAPRVADGKYNGETDVYCKIDVASKVDMDEGPTSIGGRHQWRA